MVDEERIALEDALRDAIGIWEEEMEFDTEHSIEDLTALIREVMEESLEENLD